MVPSSTQLEETLVDINLGTVRLGTPTPKDLPVGGRCGFELESGIGLSGETAGQTLYHRMDIIL